MAEVKTVSSDGFWLSLGAEQLFVRYEEFPWFKGADESKLRNVEWPHAGHLYWPDLDIDLAVESIRDPQAFPLVSRRP